MPITLSRNFATVPTTNRGSHTQINGDGHDTILYASGNTIIVRSLSRPESISVYEQHSAKTTVAKYSHNRKMIASADSNGRVRIWDPLRSTEPPLHEYTLMSGKILDLAWDPSDARLVVAGEGMGRFASCIRIDNGSSAGDIVGHTKAINSVDIQPASADGKFRMVTASVDMTVQTYLGAPYKYETTLRDHNNFVNAVRFDPTGRFFATCSSDKKVHMYDQTCKIVKTFGAPTAHEGSIFGLSFNADGSRFITASGDKTVKLWDVATGSVVTTFKFGNELHHQQVGCIWQGNNIVSIGLNGDLNYLDPARPTGPARVVSGHNKAITAMTYDRQRQRLYTGSYDGMMHSWSLEGLTDYPGFTGAGHTNEVKNMVVNPQSQNLISVALDDTLRITNLNTKQYSPASTLKLTSAPTSVATCEATPDITVVATIKSVDVYRSGSLLFSNPVTYKPTALAMAPNGVSVCVAGDDKVIHVYRIAENGQIQLLGTLKQHRGLITAIAYSPDGQFLSSADDNREIILWDRKTGTAAKSGLTHHTGRINCLAWSYDSRYLASGSLDLSIILWDLTRNLER
eukprot:TRINITY_DN4763_c0_g1_i1.p1 TRINITY_DN4763_c0_g1~~TRINITY_DN4763_c0_g1_i1.p1  ORF type:complete len:571 (+),score=111.96 TRINITY_DN4763_c0_g1_i1:66-1778(+)